MDDLRYPIGKYIAPDLIDQSFVGKSIDEIESLPKRLRLAVENLSDEQLDTPYRPDGWTVRQVVHHLVDSHINSYVRFRWTLTEVNPMIKAYYEERWAELPDAKHGSIDLSLSLLELLHNRWAYLLHSLTDKDLKKTFMHPETGQKIALDWNIGMYAWHGNHHLAHIEKLKERSRW
jgi:hypothetical protein